MQQVVPGGEASAITELTVRLNSTESLRRQPADGYGGRQNLSTGSSKLISCAPSVATPVDKADMPRAVKTSTSMGLDSREVVPVERSVPNHGWSRVARRMIMTALLLDRPDNTGNTIARVWLRAIGGLRGCVEALVPGLAFLTMFVAGAPGILPVIASALIAAVFVVARLIAKTFLVPAIVGLAGIAVPVASAALSGQVIDSFVPHLVEDAVAAVVLLSSVVARWPALGVAIGFLLPNIRWQKQYPLHRKLASLTLLWAGLFALRIAVELPIYLTRNVTAMIVATLILGLPLFAPLAVYTWWNLRSIANAIATPTQPMR